MVWSTVNFNTLVELLVPTFLRKNKHILLLKTIITPLFTLHQQTLYEMQHDGRTIYLEKLLNEYFTVLGYDPNHHDLTKTIYIDDVVQKDKLYIWQNEELETSYLNDEGVDDDNDVFLDNEIENVYSYSWIIFIPEAIVFDEIKVRAFIDEYRYIGRKYIIQNY